MHPVRKDTLMRRLSLATIQAYFGGWISVCLALQNCAAIQSEDALVVGLGAAGTSSNFILANALRNVALA